MRTALEGFSGCIVGQALGDALGFPVEGEPPEVAHLYAHEALGRRVRAGFAPLQYTDDTQLARELLLSLVACRGFNPEDFAGRIVHQVTSGALVGGGRTIEGAVRRLAAGVSWTESGQAGPNAGNGSAMRAAPVGMMFHNDPRRLVQVAVDQSRVTHTDPRCLAGSVAVAATVAALLRGETRDPLVFLPSIAQIVERVDPEFAEHLVWLVPQMTLPPEEAAAIVGRRGLPTMLHEADWPGVSPFVVPTVLWALYSFFRARPEAMFRDSVRTAIAAGGDTDTTAALAGAFAGAVVGVKGLPSLAKAVHDRGQWGSEELVGLANRAGRFALGMTAH